MFGSMILVLDLLMIKWSISGALNSMGATTGTGTGLVSDDAAAEG